MKLFGAGKPDHPMAERKEAQRLLQELPAHDGKALEELGHWHDSLGAAEGFKPEERAQRLAMVDEAAAPRLKKLEREYLASARASKGSRAQENVLWTRMHDYWRRAAQAHLKSIDAQKPLPGCVLAALRALGQQLKWQQLRYGPIDLELWGQMNRIYAAAEARGMIEATPEYLKAALFSAASPDSLPVHELALAERLINELAAQGQIGNTPLAELPYWVDLARAMAPARGAKPAQPAASVRYIGPCDAAALLRTLTRRVEAQRQVPPELKLGTDYDAETLLGVMRRLAMHWAPTAPERKHKRHSMSSRLKIAHGFEGVLEVLGGSSGSLDFGAAIEPESWKVENVSAGGFGALAPQSKSDWLKVGALVAAQPDGTGSWLIGTVRRVSKVSAQEVRVGVETLSRAPTLSQFALRNAAPAQGVLLPPPVPGNGDAAIALRAGVHVPGENLEATIGGRQHVYMPQGIAERGEDYEIVRFKAMVRES